MRNQRTTSIRFFVDDFTIVIMVKRSLPLKPTNCVVFLTRLLVFTVQRKKTNHPVGWLSYLAGALGLEPRRTVLETAMLPLHHAPRWLLGVFLARMQYCN